MATQKRGASASHPPTDRKEESWSGRTRFGRYPCMDGACTLTPQQELHISGSGASDPVRAAASAIFARIISNTKVRRPSIFSKIFENMAQRPTRAPPASRVGTPQPPLSRRAALAGLVLSPAAAASAAGEINSPTVSASVVVRLFAAKIQNCGREGLHIMTASMQLVHEGCGARHITVDGAVPGHSH